MNPILEIKNISKKYKISHQQQAYMSLRDSLSSLFTKSNKTSIEEFWALENISFDVYPGESIGIVGRNGAGKSTLLKILSKITPPTKGKVTARGRVASLLEVGTGFHAELTGRENVFLNGSILGMKRAEITSKFDEIVEFSGVEKFLDTPLKHYSSGMQLRLAFAVAAYLEPEILLIDEVLAVGDSVFQQKCINKMNEVSRSGRTILFVSHNMAFVSALCNRGVLLSNGKSILIDQIENIITAYSTFAIGIQTEYDLTNIERTLGSKKIVFDKLILKQNPVAFGEKIYLSVILKSQKTDLHRNVDIAITINNNFNQCMVHCCNRFINKFFDHDNDEIEYFFEIDNILKPGRYSITTFLRTNDTLQDWLQNIATLEILDGNPYNYHDTVQIQGQLFPAFNISKIAR